MAKVLLITGASSGIGEATAKEAVKQGYKVVATARSEDKPSKGIITSNLMRCLTRLE